MTTLLCKKCNNILYPDQEAIKMPRAWEKGGARCSKCGYLYYPKVKETWFSECWKKDFEEKKEKILVQSYELLEPSGKEIYRILFFLDSLTNFINFYFDHSLFEDHTHLICSLKKINAKKTLAVAEQIKDLYQRRHDINAQFSTGSESIDNEWEDITYALYQSIDHDIEKKIYYRHLKNQL